MLLFSIPVIIFSVGINEVGSDYKSLINILLGLALIFLGISPWVMLYLSSWLLSSINDVWLFEKSILLSLTSLWI